MIGTDIWAYGMSGPDLGEVSAILDHNSTKASAYTRDVDYRHLLFQAHNLDEGVVHNLTFVNGQEGSNLVFDYAIVQSGEDDPV